MASPTRPRANLEHSVSQIDLSRALEEVKIQEETGMRYTSADILTYRRAGNASVRIPDGIITPINRTVPNAPPPTPATPVRSDTPGTETPKANGVSNVNEVVEDALKQLPDGEPPKKKKKGGKGGKKVNGFEEYYADAPLDPDEYMEECDMYDVNIPFESRMQTCIQRYRSRRKLDETRSNILTKFLMLGGVEATTKAFTGGLDKETLENATATEIAAIQASDFIRTEVSGDKYYDGSDKWVIDFVGVAKGFFSHRIPQMFPIDGQKQIEVYASTIRNFLNYILHHGACEDYKDDVFAARKICDLAEKELWDIKQLRSKIPGDFNVAASTLYGGRYKGVHMGDAAWTKDNPSYEEFFISDPSLSHPEAERIFKTAVAFAGSDALFKEAMKHDTRIVGSAKRFFEVVAIERPGLKARSQYASVLNVEGDAGLIKPLGALKVKQWIGPQYAPEDYSDDEKDAGVDKDAVESYWLEDDLLEHCFVGLKLELVVKTLNIGAKFIDTFEGIYCSFFIYLPNEKMFGWKEPVLGTRPPPTEDDLETDETFENELAVNDLDEVDDFLKDA